MVYPNNFGTVPVDLPEVTVFSSPKKPKSNMAMILLIALLIYSIFK